MSEPTYLPVTCPLIVDTAILSARVVMSPTSRPSTTSHSSRRMI